MKLLFYSPIRLVSGGGCERWHCDITNSLRRQFNDDIQIVTANLGPANWTLGYLNSQLKDIPYSQLHFPILFGALLPTPKAFLQLLKFFSRVDTVHVIHGFIGQDILMLIIKLITGKRIVLGWHAPIFHHIKIHNLYMRYVSRWLLNFFDGHMTLNGRDKQFLEKAWHIKNVYFIPSGVRTERFLSISRRPHSQLNFITVGQYRRQKGIDIALEAIANFNSKLPNSKAVFKFAGGGEYGPLIDRFASKYSNILNLGYIKYEDMPAVYRDSDIYFLPSREEPFGLVLVEAWSSGIPALSTRTEGPSDMIEPNKNGWFIEKISVASITRSLLQTYSHWEKSPQFLKSMIADCRKTGKRYSIDFTATRMRKSLLNENKKDKV